MSSGERPDPAAAGLLYQTHAQVHLGAIAANLRAIRSHVRPAQVLLAIKADGYGHGAIPVARMVQEQRLADRLGVATVPEGIALREAGITLPILKLSPVFAQEAAAAVAYGLDVTVVDVEGAMHLQRAAAAAHRRAAVHLKIDTGMRRIGCEPEEAPRIAAAIEADAGHVHLEGIYTHLPVSDTPDQDDWTRAQLARFAAARAQVEAMLGRHLLGHAANSGGILAHPSSWLDMVRPGVMAYGSYPDPAVPRTLPLQPALTWRSRVSFVKDVPAGESVGYGRTWVAPRATRVATVPVGYGDGYSRRLSNRGFVVIGGRRLPIVGRVCMDQLMVDLGGGAPARRVRVGDPVVLLGADDGQEITAAEMAGWLETIPYEVTCAIAPRVTRLYDD